MITGHDLLVDDGYSAGWPAAATREDFRSIFQGASGRRIKQG
jgi:hypothetical protein